MQTKEMNKHGYSISFVCNIEASLQSSTWIYRKRSITLHNIARAILKKADVICVGLNRLPKEYFAKAQDL